eukprot:TRINITY_DN608_c0_g1_i1.p1 TRINITY_DN608_c0_g1~~TRINITY_DN608_c0_g1_i1.p1  ORF type:complete len:350 (+),score=43.75 TRINITY_DN608_c0_g1_i1:76-1050(+)
MKLVVLLLVLTVSTALVRSSQSLNITPLSHTCTHSSGILAECPSKNGKCCQNADYCCLESYECITSPNKQPLCVSKETLQKWESEQTVSHVIKPQQPLKPLEDTQINYELECSVDDTLISYCPLQCTYTYCNQSSTVQGQSICEQLASPDRNDFPLSINITTQPCYNDNGTFCTSPVPLTCSWYSNCLESTLPCGYQGYAIGYGFKYCSRFRNSVSSFNSFGQQWVNATLSCLQNALVPTYLNTSLPSCDDIMNTAFNTHPTCYLESGFCQMIKSIQNMHALWNIYSLKDFLSIRAWKQILDVIEGCAEDGKPVVTDALPLQVR